MKDNIRRFGGDSTKVTIGGNSGGAALVHTLMIYMSNEGILDNIIEFSKVIHNFINVNQSIITTFDRYLRQQYIY